MSDTFEQVQRVCADISRQKERIILDQLNELLKRGLLVWEQGEEVIVQDAQWMHRGSEIKLEVRCSGRLVLKKPRIR